MSVLTRFSLRNTAAVLILVLLVTFGGLYTATQLKMEAMPDITFPVIVVITPYPGASPQDVDQKVTQPIEQSLQGITGAKKISSVSADSTSVVVVEYDFDTDLDKAKQEMQEAVDRVSLPDGAMKPSFSRFGFNTFPFMILGVTSQTKNPEELEKWVKETAEPILKTADGVGQVQIKGQGPKAVYVRLKQDQLKKYNLTVQQVQQALQASNVSIPVGELPSGLLDLPIRVDQKITSVDQLKNLRLTIQPNPQEGMEEAFNQIGQGMQGLGQAVGGLGQSVGQLGQGLGEVGQGVGLLQAQVRILQAAQQLQAQLLGDQIALNAAEMRLKQNPQDQEAAAQVALLKPKVAAEMQSLKQLNAQLSQMQKQMPQSKGAPAGGVPRGMGEQVKTSGKPKIKEAKIQTVKLSEIADISESRQDSTMITRMNGKPSVNIELIKDPDGNIVEAAEAVSAKLETLKKQDPNVQFTLLFDQSRAVKASIRSMVREGLLGALFAAVVILLFLRNFRTTLIAVVSIPLSVLATLILLKQADITLNVMTLGGLAVAIGRVVDDSIVVIENIYRHLMKNRDRTVDLIIYATKEVGAAITSSTLTTVAVFVPLGLVSGIVGKVFLPFALTVVFALLCSLIVAVTVVPLMAKLMLLNKGKRQRFKEKESGMAAGYRRALAWALDHRGVVLSVSALALFASLFLIPLVGTSFLPSNKDKAVQVKLELPPGTDLSTTDAQARKLEAKLRTYPQVKQVSTTVGNLRGQLAGDGTIGSTNKVSLFANLDPDTDMDRFLSQVRTDLGKIKGNGELQVLEVKSIGPPSSQIVAIIKGERMEDIRKTADILTNKMKKVSGLTNVTNNLSEQKELVSVHVDQAKAAQHGLVPMQVAMSIRGLLQADKIGELEKGNQTEEIKLGLENKDLYSVERLKAIQLLTPTGKMVKLGDIASVRVEQGPVTIQKENGSQYAQVSGDVIDKDTGALSRQVQQIINGMKLPSGVKVTLGGDTEEMQKSFAQLGVAMVVAVAAVYLVMIVTFGEATAPFTILFSLPFAVIGGLVGLYLSDQPISVSAMIGALMLIGIVVTNAIVLIDRVQQQRARGLDISSALLEAAGTRLRPILMTALATVFALLPLGLGYGEGSLISQGLAVVVIGGLTSSTLLTLFIVPIMYSILTRVRDRLTRNRRPEAKTG
ncbi:efflux RND transporter permease subunit [Polycladomyces subterraneus]|uniref:Efflux RND transporter permease subunit n=1 Tax=Polycladomyces subterraneus TaxID=1016997 RepID=A0ABT8IPP1_9BACL|nr:efflux RND transporter permease subunit [Polycladomyces subterraneus]MDN4594362.1 efflux RND transporter permease subunit [Polycladomyces subterraneus]